MTSTLTPSTTTPLKRVSECYRYANPSPATESTLFFLADDGRVYTSNSRGFMRAIYCENAEELATLVRRGVLITNDKGLFIREAT